MASSSDKAPSSFGTLIPKGGGDAIPLLKEKLLIGRRESCDIVLRFGNVSGHHCELSLEGGYWFITDLNSQNGTRVNGYRVTKRRVDPNDELSVARLHYELQYVPAELGAEGPPPDIGDLEEILGQSLLSAAGLDRRNLHEERGMVGRKKKPDLLDPIEDDPPTEETSTEESTSPDDGDTADE